MLEMGVELAPEWNVGNNSVWQKYIDIAFVVSNSVILLITSVVGISANIFVILAVYHQKSLQTCNNALVVNLAVIDTLRCGIDCPILLTIVMNVYQGGNVDGMICDAQMVSFSFSCCIQLLTLACISAERYQAIAQPFKTNQSRRRIMIIIPLTWSLAIVIAGFCLFFLKDSSIHVRCKGLQRETSLSYDTFGIYLLFPLWAVCFGIIIGFYTRIFFLVRSHNRKIFDKGTFLPSNRDKTVDKQEKVETTTVENGHEKSEQNQTLSMSVGQVEPVTKTEPNSSKKDFKATLLTSTQALQCLSFSSGCKAESNTTQKITDLDRGRPRPPVIQTAVQTQEKPFKVKMSNACAKEAEAKPSNGNAVKISASKVQASSYVDTEKQYKKEVENEKASSESEETSPHYPSSAQIENPESTSVLLIELKTTRNNNGGESLAVPTVEASSFPSGSNHAPDTEGTKIHMEMEGAVCMRSSKARKERASKKKESKMAKRAGYIIITFLLFWLPLISTILVNFVVHKNLNTQIAIMQDVKILSASAACITSLTDPIIYAAVNPQFRIEFCRLKTRFQTIFSKKL